MFDYLQKIYYDNCPNVMYDFLNNLQPCKTLNFTVLF